MLKQIFPTLTPRIMPLTKLHNYPRQSGFFDPARRPKLDLLKADLEQNGQRDPVHVLPPRNAAHLPAFTILDGHQRANLLRELGIANALVVVRSDLAKANAFEVERTFLQFNSLRRQLHPLDEAACYSRLAALRQRHPDRVRRYSAEDRAIVREIAALMELSPRHVQRLFRILQLPRPLQRAVRDGHLPQSLAEKLESLPSTAREEIACKIADLDVKKIQAFVRSYFPGSNKRSKSGGLGPALRVVEDELSNLMTKLDQGNHLAGIIHAGSLRKLHSQLGLLLDGLPISPAK